MSVSLRKIAEVEAINLAVDGIRVLENETRVSYQARVVSLAERGRQEEQFKME